MSHSRERDLEQFLVALPACIRKEFESGADLLTPDEIREWAKVDGAVRLRFLEEYRSLLRHIPAKWHAYCTRENKAHTQLFFPGNPGGRPRKDSLASEAMQLKQAGHSYAQIANRLNREHGEGTATTESVRGLLRTRKRESRKPLPPDKTPH